VYNEHKKKFDGKFDKNKKIYKKLDNVVNTNTSNMKSFKRKHLDSDDINWLNRHVFSLDGLEYTK